jgi:hypothetical protein
MASPPLIAGDLNDQQAFTQALYLALTAPTAGEADVATKLAERLAEDLTPVQIERAKERAKAMASDQVKSV